MELLLLLSHYFTAFLYFFFLYRLLQPKFRFLVSFLIYFLLGVLFAGSINAFVVPYESTFLRISVVIVSVYVWTCICCKGSLVYKTFAVCVAFFLSYLVEGICMLTNFIFTQEKMIEIVVHQPVLLFYRIYASTLTLLAYEILLHLIRKYKFYEIPYAPIVILTLFLTLVIGDFVQFISTNYESDKLIQTAFIAFFTSSILIVFLLKIIHKEYEKKKVEVAHKEIETQYQNLLEDYLNVSDTKMLQKYLRHDLLNHLETLEKVEKKQNKP